MKDFQFSILGVAPAEYQALQELCMVWFIFTQQLRRLPDNFLWLQSTYYRVEISNINPYVGL